MYINICFKVLEDQLGESLTKTELRLEYIDVKDNHNTYIYERGLDDGPGLIQRNGKVRERVWVPNIRSQTITLDV